MFAAAALALLVSLALAVTRAIKGPTVFDRVLAGNMVGSLAILLQVGRLTRRRHSPSRLQSHGVQCARAARCEHRPDDLGIGSASAAVLATRAGYPERTP
jgi:hypothetical protein